MDSFFRVTMWHTIVCWICLLPLTMPSAQEDNFTFIESFEVVWQTMDERYFDLNFSGVDWLNAYDHNLPLIHNVNTELEFCEVVNEMLLKLGVSHLGVVPADEPSLVGSPDLFETGSLGLNTRYFGGEVVITKVVAGSPAANAGIFPGDVMLALDGVEIREVIAEATEDMWPPYDERFNVPEKVKYSLFAPAGSSSRITVGKPDGTSVEHELSMAERGNAILVMPELPPVYADTEYHLLSPDIAYLRFSSFTQANVDDVLAAIDDANVIPGMVIDLRGNPGGVFEVRLAIASKFSAEPVLFWTQEYRDHNRAIHLEPSNLTYHGELVIIIDALTGSSAEEFAGGMQAIGRAVIAGERSRGADLVMDVMQLPCGSIFIYPVARTVMADGTVLEGRGVIPDIAADWDKAQLQQGVDSQLEAAVAYLLGG